MVTGTEFWLCNQIVSEVMPAEVLSLVSPQVTQTLFEPRLSSESAFALVLDATLGSVIWQFPAAVLMFVLMRSKADPVDGASNAIQAAASAI
jgi:hypothetical protein